MAKRISDPIDRIVDLVFDAQGDMTLNELCLPGVREFIVDQVGEAVTAEFRRWYEAECAIKDLELQEKMRLGEQRARE